MKKLLYSLVGVCWGIFLFNKEILLYAIFISVITILADFLTDDK